MLNQHTSSLPLHAGSENVNYSNPPDIRQSYHIKSESSLSPVQKLGLLDHAFHQLSCDPVVYS